MSYCELYARRVIAELEPLLRPQGGGRLALPVREPERDALWEISEARFSRVHELLEGADAALLAFGLCVAVHVYPETAVYLREHAHIGAVTVESAAQLLGGEGYAFAPDRLEESSRALGELLWTEGSPSPDYRAPLEADGRLVDWLGGGNRLPEALAGICRRFSPAEPLHPFFARPELPDRLTGELKRLAAAEEAGELAGGACIQITGGPGAGKRLLLQTAAARLGFGVLFADAERLMEPEEGPRASLLRLIRREAVLYGDALCFHGLVSADDERAPRRFLRCCLEPLGDLEAPVFLCTDPGFALLPYTDRHTVRFDLPPCTRADRIALWQGFWEYYGLKAEGDFARYAATYKTSPRDIGKAVRQLARLERAGEPVDAATVSGACYMALPRAVSGKIVQVPQGWTLDDLKLPEDQKRMLRHVCTHVLRRHQVYDEWGLESKYPYGKAVSVLFAGPPGTGKTMAANILASILGLALYRVDLSQVVDKYIGESEKRLEQVFATAEKSNVLLFFDEADSIFGKRSEVKEANDRFANIQVSYILQRIEDYDGVVLLATNLKKNIDEAFMRRMRYVVEFQLPGEAQREELWRACLPETVPSSGVDFGYLARRFELAGGAIKNIALNAAFLAAEEDGPVTMRHILDSLRNENLKRGKTMLNQDFAEYGFLYERPKA